MSLAAHAAQAVHAALAAVAKERALPCALVDLAAFDRNCAHVARLAATKRVRIATKSIRVPALIERVLARGAPFFGVMAYDAREATLLVERGIHDVLIAYPCMDAPALAQLRRAHEAHPASTISLMVDGPENVAAIAEAMNGLTKERAFRVVIDVDMSLRPAFARGHVHLGVRRSPVRSVDDVLALVDDIARFPSLRLHGLMGYEAQVAGLGDAHVDEGSMFSLRTRALDLGKRAVRRASVNDGRARREAIARALAEKGVSIELFNGGGSGSLDTTSAEACITEVTAGSALYAPHLFDHFSNVRYEPSLYFALRVTRSSDLRFVTCAGGGYIASGAPGWDKVPLPVWPVGASLVDTEGCGEVQTPLLCAAGSDASRLRPGDVVLFRHAKAGELFERMPHALLIDDAASANARVVNEVPSYRGLGWSFA
jgi:D-serine deaminase-like pyridoxal phosphate-dependent protein